jgi:hypothetical protein
MGGMADPILKIPIEEITSSNLAGAGYDRERQILAIQFKSGIVFHYSGVDLDTATAFYMAGSRGSFYATRIRGKFTGARVTGECLKCGARHGYIGETCDDCGSAVVVEVPRPERASA